MAESPAEPEPFTQAQQDAWQAIVVQLRHAISHSVQLDAPLEVLQALSAQLGTVVATLEKVSGAKPVPRFKMPFDRASPDDYLAYSPVSGRLNPLAPPVALTVEDGRIIARVTLGLAYEGGVGFAHGGVVALIWDQVLALANVAAGVAGPTGELRVRYVAPTPIGRELRFEAWHERQEGRRIIALGRCYVEDMVVTEAEGVFITLDAATKERAGWGGQTQGAGALPARRQARGTT